MGREMISALSSSETAKPTTCWHELVLIREEPKYSEKTGESG